MTPRITPEMHQALSANPGRPLYVFDDDGGTSYVLIAASAYEKVQPLLYDASDPALKEFLPLVHKALAGDWDAPGMDLYDDYDKRRPQP